jgi:hypothetical protein
MKKFNFASRFDSNLIKKVKIIASYGAKAGLQVELMVTRPNIKVHGVKVVRNIFS